MPRRRVDYLGSNGKHLGAVEAPDEKSGIAEAMKTFHTTPARRLKIVVTRIELAASFRHTAKPICRSDGGYRSRTIFLPSASPPPHPKTLEYPGAPPEPPFRRGFSFGGPDQNGGFFGAGAPSWLGGQLMPGLLDGSHSPSRWLWHAVNSVAIVRPSNSNPIVRITEPPRISSPSGSQDTDLSRLPQQHPPQ